jgi:hypothetical protein
MQRKQVTESIRAFFGDFAEDMELYDEHGRVVAFVKRPMRLDDPENWVLVSPPVSDEEWKRLRDCEEPGLTTKELLEHLRGRR